MSSENMTNGLLQGVQAVAQALKIDMLESLAFLFSPMRYKGAKGGRGSGKSWGFARALCLLGHQSKKLIMCAREIQLSISKSVFPLLIKQIQELQLDDATLWPGGVYHYNKERIWHDNGTEFFFVGLWNNIDNIKSTEGVDICWIEEANTVSEASWVKLLPTIRKPGSEIWFTYNPESEYDAVHQRFAKEARPDCILVTINHRDNPWLSQELKNEMEWDKKRNFKEYLWTWEGFTKEAAGETIFLPRWYNTWHNPDSIQGNLYIIVDPANSKGKKSDYTVIWVLVAAPDRNLYILEGVRDRLEMEKFDILFALYQKYSRQQRFRSITVGYERYGMQMDINYIKERQERTGQRFKIVELGAKSSGKLSKVDRTKRLVPYFSEGRFWFPDTLPYHQLDGKDVDLIELLKQELAVFHPVQGIPEAFHDDLSDALSRVDDAELRIEHPDKFKVAPEDKIRRKKEYDPARYGFE